MGIVFVRTAFFDLIDIQGDKIVGRETLPIFIGEEKTRRLLKKILIVLSILPFLYSLSGILPLSAAIVFIVPVLLYLIISANEKGNLLPGFKLVFLVETTIILVGMLTYLALF
jgi:4-hydroxy-3-methylbut-2-enyl diphosphate reductase